MSKSSNNNFLVCSDKMTAPMKFEKMKLSKLSQGESYGVVGFYPMDTKFGKTFVLLLDNDERVFSNKTIANYINECWDTSSSGMVFDKTPGVPMFAFTVGETAEYNGHTYNKIIIN